MSPDVPFVFRAGTDELTSLHNRMGAIERIKFLSGIDLRDKSTEYKYLLDCELYIKYYKDFPSQTVDEEYCQRAAEIVKQFEKEKKEDLDKATEGATDRVKQLYRESHKALPQEPSDSPQIDITPRNWFENLWNKIFPSKFVFTGRWFKKRKV